MSGVGIIYPIVILFVKLSLFLLYLRVFGVRRTFRFLVYGGITFCVLCYTAYTGYSIGTTVLCNGIEAEAHALCKNANVITVFSGAINVVTDFYLLALPVVPLTQLHMQTRRKLGLIAIFMTGFM